MNEPTADWTTAILRPPTIEWRGEHVAMIDQTLLPGELVILQVRTVDQMAEAIRMLRIRGAPAIGVAAAYGVVLGAQESTAGEPDALRAEIEQAITRLRATRPTAVNLSWALDRMAGVIDRQAGAPPEQVKKALLKEALEIHREDAGLCLRIGQHGDELIPDGARVLTHCNAGRLATGGIGTALGVIYTAHHQGKQLSVCADETRPLLQGARLTAWELDRAGIPVTLLCDNAAGRLMSEGRVDLALVGADRIAANGDVANKIGTYQVAVLCHRHKIPFYVAAPFSTLDLSLEDGGRIPIEERGAGEIVEISGRCLAPPGIGVYSPAFDVTPAELVTAIITDRGVCRPPYRESLSRLADSG
jgi:methylthioribose-1-phosphate isomerase